MEITGSFYSPITYAGMDPADRYPQHPPNPSNQQAAPRPPVKQTVKTEANDPENRQRRFYPIDQDVSHSARQAIQRYQVTDQDAGPELLSRVDVFA